MIRAMVSKTRPFRTRFALAALATFVLAGSLPLQAGAAGAPPAGVPVPVLAVGSSTSAGALELDGSLQARRQATVAAQVGGNVVQLAVKAGDHVKAGQLLLRIDDRDTAAGLARSDAAVVQAEAEARNARTHLARQRELRAQGFVSQAALDMADTQAQAAQAGAAQARAARGQAALARGFAHITAPFDGVVQATLVEAGDLATPGRPLLTLYAPGALRAVVQMPASRSALARAATRVQVQLPDGRWATPVARQELPAADAVSQTVEWRLDLGADTLASAGAVSGASPGAAPTATAAATALALAPGQAVRVRFSGAATGAATPAAAGAVPRLSVPAAAVLQRGELTAVYVALGTQFVLRPVRLGSATADTVDVLAGLKPGEKVALNAVQAGLAGAHPAPAGPGAHPAPRKAAP